MRSENFKTPNQVRITNLYKMALETQAPKLSIPAGNYKFKGKNRNTRTKCDKCSKLIIKTPERR